MNERIFDMIQEQNGNRGLLWTEEDKEEFAELIVRQCIYLVENLPPGYKDYRNQIEDSFRIDCIEKIEQYFGILEKDVL